MNNNPIGIFDSGVGGLSIASSIRDKLPNENIVYIADSLHAPYGSKSKDFIIDRSSLIVNSLLTLKAKAIVVACNTATVSAIQKLRNDFPVPFIGVEPGVKPAVSLSRTGVVGVLATEQTIASESFNNLVKRFSNRAQIEVKACPGFVDLVETINFDENDAEVMIKQYVFPLLDKGVDTIVMGCTHFAFLTSFMEKILGSDVRIINTYQAVSKEVVRKLTVENLLALEGNKGSELFFSSRVDRRTDPLFSKLWRRPVTVLHI